MWVTRLGLWGGNWATLGEKLSRIWVQDFMSLLSPSYPGNPPLLSLSSDPAFDQTSVVWRSVAALLPIFAANSTILPTFRQQSIDVRQGGSLLPCPHYHQNYILTF